MTAVVASPLYHDVGYHMLGAREAEVPVKLDRDLRQARPASRCCEVQVCPCRRELVHRLGVVGEARAELLGGGFPVGRSGKINAGRIAVYELRELVLEAGGDLQRVGV